MIQADRPPAIDTDHARQIVNRELARSGADADIPANTPRGMKAHQMSSSSLLTPAARNRRRSPRLFMVYSSSSLLAMRKLAWRTDLWSASGAIAPPRRTILAFPEKRPRYAFVRR